MRKIPRFCTELKFVPFWLILLSKFGCHGNSLGFLYILDSIFEVADTDNLSIHVRKILDFWHRTEISEILAYFLPKFGCHGNSLGSLKILGSMSEFADPQKLYYLCDKFHDFLHRTEIAAILSYFCLNLVAMVTPLVLLKIAVAYLNSPTLYTTVFLVREVELWKFWNLSQLIMLEPTRLHVEMLMLGIVFPNMYVAQHLLVFLESCWKPVNYNLFWLCMSKWILCYFMHVTCLTWNV